MLEKIQEIVDKFIPYLMLGIGIAMLIGLLILLAHMVIAGLIIGTLLFIIQAIRERFFSGRRSKVHLDEEGHRIIEHDQFP